MFSAITESLPVCPVLWGAPPSLCYSPSLPGLGASLQGITASSGVGEDVKEEVSELAGPGLSASLWLWSRAESGLGELFGEQLS